MMTIERPAVPAEPLSRPRRIAPALALVLWAAASPGFAEDSCQDGLQAAEKSYQIGLFEEVPGHLAPCLTGSAASRTERVHAYALLAKARLAMDEPEKAREAVSALLRTDPAFEPGPPAQFAQLVQEVRREEATVQVASVSKTKESLREAPATVVVLTAEEIGRRGYIDFEEMLHDLPGFDISRGNGEAYSNFYMRGLRSNFNDRNLLLLDGVEQNDLASNIVSILSRQYSLSDVERVEVVYGPASTLYGANAYTGVISILTKEPEALIAEGRRFGYRAQAGGGTFDTKLADLALAGRTRSGNVAWSLAGRVFRSDEDDLSDELDWDYDFSDRSDAVYHSAMRLSGVLADAFCNAPSAPCERLSPLYFVGTGPRGERTIEASDIAVALARELDRQAVRSLRLDFSDRTENWSLYAKVRISNLTFGLQRWRTDEGTAPWLTELNRPGEGSGWAPDQTMVYLKWAGSVGRDLSLQVFTRYIQSSLDRRDSQVVLFHNYANYLLRITDLLNPCTDPNGQPTGELCPQQPWVEVTSYGQLSSELKNEATFVYSPSEKLSVVGGLELRKSSIQERPDTVSAARGDSRPPRHRQAPVIVQSETNEHTDVGLYAQASYRLRKSWKAVLAGRVDYNEINNRRPAVSGFGTLFTPRAALIYTPDGTPFVFKAIYSEAFKDPTDFEKFGTIPFIRDHPSGGLRPERVRNFELAGDWQPAENASIEAAAYQADYRDVVGLRQLPGCILSAQGVGCGQLANLGELRIRGVQVNARYSAGGLDFFGNYTYTEPFDTRPDPDPISPATGSFFYPGPLHADEIRIGDIASHRLNAGFELEPLPKLTVNFRMSYVGPRKTGAGTTVFTNPYREIDDYLVPKLALTWRELLPGTDLQLVVNNPFGVRYHHPGVQTAGFGFAPRLPQPGRTVFFRLLSGGPRGEK